MTNVLEEGEKFLIFEGTSHVLETLTLINGYEPIGFALNLQHFSQRMLHFFSLPDLIQGLLIVKKKMEKEVIYSMACML